MYNNYINFLHQTSKNDTLRNAFKSNPQYNGILEHVSLEQGKQYLEIIKDTTDISMEEIKDFCILNDKIGEPTKYDYGFIKTSPTNFRYILHSYLIIKHFISLQTDKFEIVELGGGYGGLYLAITFFAKKYGIPIDSYNIIDLYDATILQRWYLEQQGITNVGCIDSNTFGENIKNNNMFLISNYCFSEISREYQEKYIKMLFPKVSHGFMCWNFIPIYNFGFSVKTEIEYPLTSNENLYVYF